MSGMARYPFLHGTVEIGYEGNLVIAVKCISVADAAAEDQKTKLTDMVYRQLQEYANGYRTAFEIPYIIHGTEFQKKVWHALMEIPYGQTRTYKEIAEVIGSPKSCRAVGMANNKNPLNIIIPCHRVIGSDGNLVGYAGGLDMKQALLELEKAGKNSCNERTMIY